MNQNLLDSNLLFFVKAEKDQLDIALVLLKEAALFINSKKIDHWQQWLSPTKENIDWIKSGFENQEFYFVNYKGELAGMFRAMDEDLKYWGKQNEAARYLHSLVIKRKFSGMGMGKAMIEKLITQTKLKGVNLVRLDCVASNKRLCSYYENLGFQLVKEQVINNRLHNYYQKIIG